MLASSYWKLAMVASSRFFFQLNEGEQLRSEHGEVESVEPCQRDELELVAHAGELVLEAGDGRVVQILLPVERGRAVIGQQLAGIDLVHACGEFACFLEIGLGGFAPENIRIRRVSNGAGDGDL